MLGISYGQLLLIIGATAVLIKPKDLPIFARTAGRLVGRAVGYVLKARGQFESVMQHTQANKVHKEIQDSFGQLQAIHYEIRSTSMMNPAPFSRRLDGAEPPLKNVSGASVVEKPDVEHEPSAIIPKLRNEIQDLAAQLEAIRYEIRSISMMNPTPFSRSLDGAEPPLKNGASVVEKPDGEHEPSVIIPKDLSFMNTIPSNLHSQVLAYAKLAEAPTIKSGSYKGARDVEKLNEDGGLLNVLPISAESAGLLPKRSGELKGSDIALQAILEEEVARIAKHAFSHLQSQLPKE